jgi:hypothetical protein
MSRCVQTTVTDTIICAKACYQKFNDSPLAKFSFNDYVLVDDSTYYDSNLISLREIRWKVFVGDYFFYDFLQSCAILFDRNQILYVLFCIFYY